MVVEDEGWVVVGSYWFESFQDIRYMDHMGIAVVNTKLFINKSWIKCPGTAVVTQTVTCEPVGTQPYGVNFSGT